MTATGSLGTESSTGVWQQVRDGDKGLEWNPQRDPPAVEWRTEGGGPSRPFRLERVQGCCPMSRLSPLPSLHQQLIPNLASPPT